MRCWSFSQGRFGNGQVLQAIVENLGGLTAVGANNGMMPSGAAALDQLLQQVAQRGPGNWLSHNQKLLGIKP